MWDSKIRGQLRPPLYLLFALIYLLWAGGWQGLQGLFGLLLLLAIALAFPDANKGNKVVGITLFGLGILLLVFAGGDSRQWLTALTANAGLVALFITLPLYSILLSNNDYVTAMDRLFHRYVRRGWIFFSLGAACCGFLGAVMNLGGMTLMYELLRPYKDHYGGEVEMAQAMTRGNLFTSYWAPCHMSVATVVTYTGISWLELAPRGFLLSLLQLAFIMACFYVATGPAGRQVIDFAGIAPEGGAIQALSRQDKQVLAELLLVYSGLVGLVALLNRFTALPVLAIISFAAFTYPPMVALLKGNRAKYGEEWRKYRTGKLRGIANQVIMFSSVGFFGKAVEYAGIGQYIVGKLNIGDWQNPSLMVVVLALLMLALGLLGIHPVITIIAFSTALGSASLILTPLQLAYTYLLGYSVTVIVSPFFAVALTMSALSGQNPWAGMGRHNLLYSLGLILFFSLVIPRI